MNFEALFGLLVFLTLALLIVVSYKGFLYDISKEEIDRKYKNNHSITWIGLRFRFSIPRIIFDNTENKELQKKINAYNRLSIIFWISVIATTTSYFLTK